MNRKLFLTLAVLILCGNAFGQIVKYRVGGNYGKFVRELNEEVEHPLVEQLSAENSTDFTSAYEAGFEAEVMLLWTENMETGLEMEFANFSGTNEIPRYYNYIFSPDFPDINYITTEPLMYESSALSFKLNFRYYLAPSAVVNPFVKAFGGLSFVGTDFNYQDQTAWNEGEPGILYSIGTKNSSDPKESAFSYGAGAGIDFKISEKISLYVDGNASIINSDKVDGIPNYDYINNQGQQTLKPVGNKSFVTKFSVGLVFTSDTNLGLNKNWGKNKNKRGSGIRKVGKTTPWRPFYRQK